MSVLEKKNTHIEVVILRARSTYAKTSHKTSRLYLLWSLHKQSNITEGYKKVVVGFKSILHQDVMKQAAEIRSCLSLLRN